MRRLRTTLVDWFAAAAVAEQGRGVLWLPVFMGAGVLLYFGLRFEPPVWLGTAVLPGSAVVAIAARRRPWIRGFAFTLTAAALGFASSQWATARAPPILSDLPPRATVVTGVVAAVELLPEGRRITLDSPRLEGTDDPLPRRIRVRLRANDKQEIGAGDLVRIRALIRPPAPPAYPGAWDLQRDAFYAGLGGSGFALAPLERLAAADTGGWHRVVQKLRETIAARILAVIPGAAGQVCVTLLTGASTGIPLADHAAFRDSGLAHLLAVAGLHIGVVMGFAIAVTRRALAFSEYATLHWPTKKIAAIAGLAAGAAYMVLTGSHVPIMRSFAMACLFVTALLAGRRPVSLRGLALAAVALMLVAPQEVPGVSFQMSFSAVLALIAGYEALRPSLRRLHGHSPARRFGAHLAALALTSALAGTASAPYGAYHFGHVQVYYVLANMVAVPLTALWVMPAGLIALPLMPFGLEWLVLVPMGWGAEGVVWVARATAALPVATFDVPPMPGWGIVVLSLGIAWLGIWRSRLRLAGIAPIVLGLCSPLWFTPADILVSADARLIGVRTEAGVFMQQASGAAKFTRDAWLQYWTAHDGVLIPHEGDAGDGAVRCAAGSCLLSPREDVRAAVLVREPPLSPETCRAIAVIVSAEPARGLCPRPWPKLVDRFTVWRNGASAVWLGPRSATVLTDRAVRGDRPWVPPVPQRRRTQPAPGEKVAASDDGGTK